MRVPAVKKINIELPSNIRLHFLFPKSGDDGEELSSGKSKLIIVSFVVISSWLYECMHVVQIYMYIYQVISSELCLVPHEMFAFYVTNRVLQCSFRFYN